MFQVIVTFVKGYKEEECREEKQGKYLTKPQAEARKAALMKNYPGVIKECRIEPTGKDKK